MKSEKNRILFSLTVPKYLSSAHLAAIYKTRLFSFRSDAGSLKSYVMSSGFLCLMFWALMALSLRGLLG